MSSQQLGQPGISSAKTFTPRRVFLAAEGKMYYPNKRLLKGSSCYDPGNTGDTRTLRPGTILGKITASGLYAPFAVGVLQNAYSSGAFLITVTAAQAVGIVGRIGTSGNLRYVGPPAALGTVQTTGNIAFSAVNTTTGVITVSNIGVNLVAGSFVCDTDGSYTPITFIDDDDFPLVVDPEDHVTTRDVEIGRFPIAGLVESAQLLVAGSAWPADVMLRSWIYNRLNDIPSCKFIFDDVL